MTRQTRTILGLGLVVLLGMAAAVWMVLAPSTPTAPEGPDAVDVPTPGEDDGETPETTGRRRARRQGTAVISGDVRRSRGDAPVAGQVVVLELEDAEPWTAQTDTSGAFRFEKLPGGGPYEVRVASDGFATVRLPGIALDHGEERELGTLWLDAAVRAEILVRSLADVPIPGAEVLAFAAPELTSFDWSRAMAQMATPAVPVAQATTDADGHAVFPELAAGSWTFTAKKDGYAMRGRPAERLRAEEERGALTIYLGRGYRLFGHVKNQDGKPIADALLLAAPPNMAWSPQVAPLRDRVVADETGEYAFTSLASGSVVLWAGLPDGPVGQVATVVVPAVGEFDVVLRDGGVLRGKVTLRDSGEPVAGARVVASSWGRGGGRSAEATTDEEGAYVIDTLSEGTVNRLTVEKEGLVPAADPSAPQRFQGFPIRRGETVERNFELAQGGSVAGIVSGPSGPLGGVRVTVMSQSPQRGLERKYATTDDAGRYEVEAMRAGNALVQADKAGFFQPDFPAQWWMALNQKGGDYKVEVEAGKTATMDIALGVGAVVEGTVQLTDGTPVGGARVTGMSAGMWPTVSRNASAATEADGTFRLEGLAPAAQVRLTPAKPGLGAIPPEPIEVAAEPATTGVVLQMEMLPRVRGNVLSVTGEPVEDTFVQITFRPPMENGRPVYFDPTMTWTQANRHPVLADGTYDVEIPGVRGAFWVRAGGPELAGVSSGEQALVEGQSEYVVDLAFAAGDELSGRVVVKDGDDPVAGAHVTVTPARTGGSRRDREMLMAMEAGGRGGGIVAVTDASGAFAVRGLAKGSYRIGVTADGYVNGNETAEVPAGSEVRVKLSPELEISGIVVFGDGRPVEGVRVTAQGAGSGNTSVRGGGGMRMVVPGGGGGVSTTTDAHGRFVIRGLREGSYKLAVSAQWGSTANVLPFTSEPFAAGTANVRLAARAGLSLTGKVLGSDGKGVSGAMVNANPEERRPGRTSRGVQTTADGSFTIAGLEEGVYTLSVSVNAWTGGEAYQPATRKGVAAGTTGIEIALASGMSIEGVVVDEEGRPMLNGWVQATPIQDGATRPTAPRQPAMLDAKGHFKLGGLQAGRYSLRANSFGADGAAQMILTGGEDVAAGTTGLRLTATKGGTISGKVVSESGEPIERARVNAQPIGGGRGQSARTRDDGSFEITGLSGTAAMKLTVSADGYMTTEENGVAVGDTGVRLEMRAGFRAQGVLLGVDGKPLARVRIEFRDGKDKRVQRATTSEKGEFDVGGLPEGTFTVRAWLQKSDGSGWTQQECGTIRAGDAGATLQVSE